MPGISISEDRDTFTVEESRRLNSIPFEFWGALLNGLEKAFADERKRGEE